MRISTFDAFEFEEPHSEQRLEVAISRRSDWPHPKVEDFVCDVARCEGFPLPGNLPLSVSFASTPVFAAVSGYLERFNLLSVPADCGWPCYLMKNDWNELCVVLDTGVSFVCVRWETTA